MSASARSSRLGGSNGYRRPSSRARRAYGPGYPRYLRHRRYSRRPRRPGSRSCPGLLRYLGGLGYQDTQKAAERRDHVKVARSLADEMRDAVWFFSEHGRPRDGTTGRSAG